MNAKTKLSARLYGLVPKDKLPKVYIGHIRLLPDNYYDLLVFGTEWCSGGTLRIFDSRPLRAYGPFRTLRAVYDMSTDLTKELTSAGYIYLFDPLGKDNKCYIQAALDEGLRYWLGV